MAELTQILQAVERGEEKSSERLLPLVYEELRRLAAAKMSGEPENQTLQPTALVHDAWLRLTVPRRCNGRTGVILWRGGRSDAPDSH